MSESGHLYIVATPIGNLADMTLRAIETLKQVDLIAAEDTRNAGRLLKHYDIATKCVSVHDHNEQQKLSWLEQQLSAGLSIALISDAGTPLINDPGYHLVKHCKQLGFKVIPIPGACAAIAALSVAGLPTDRFSYEGFLPAKTKGRCDRLNALADSQHTLVFYESPHRILDSLADMEKCLGPDRIVVMARELTKTFETVVAKPVAELRTWVSEDANQQKGEFVLVVAAAQAKADAIPAEAIATLELLNKELPLKKAAALCAQIHGLKKNALYSYGLEHF